MAAERGEALRIAIVGAESTGKTALAGALAGRLAAETGLACTAVPEVLREWCDREGRTPRADEQWSIAQAQLARIEAAAAGHDVVVCDTTPLMTAVYSAMLFGDHGLDEFAIGVQRGMALTLLTALDLPWVADGLQRDGPQVREPVDGRVRALLLRAGVRFSVVSGSGPARLASALDAVTPLLAARPAPRGGLFSRLLGREAALPAWRFTCELCDDPDCEHASRRLRDGGC